MMQGIIFDLDGTLVDSAPDIHAASNALLRSMGYPPLSYEQVRSFIGNGIPKLVERVMQASDIPFTAERHQGLTATFEGLYGKKPAEKSVLYPGVLETLKRLQKSGYVLGVCTNKNYKLTLKVLKGVGINGFFNAVVGGDSLAQRKPDPAPFFACAREMSTEQVIYVGDSEVDADTALAAKVPFLLFTEGYRKGPIEAMVHAHRFNDFNALPDLVKSAFSDGDGLAKAS